MPYKYYDKKGTLIREGDTLIHENGATEEKVYACQADENDEVDLGFLASNIGSLAFTKLEYYPLSEFNTSEWIVKEVGRICPICKGEGYVTITPETHAINQSVKVGCSHCRKTGVI